MTERELEGIMMPEALVVYLPPYPGKGFVRQYIADGEMTSVPALLTRELGERVLKVKSPVIYRPVPDIPIEREVFMTELYCLLTRAIDQKPNDGRKTLGVLSIIQTDHYTQFTINLCIPEGF